MRRRSSHPARRRRGGVVGTIARALAAIALVTATACGGADVPVDLILHSGDIWTGVQGAARPQAVAVRDGAIVAVGSTSEVRAMAGPSTRSIDLAGRTLLPGIVDSHVHFIDGGFKLSQVQLRDAASPAEFTRRIRDYAARVPPGTWITGGDWDHERWGGELPRRSWIDSVTADHPVFVNRLDGHMALANSAALAAAGVTRQTADPVGGTIERDRAGAPAGVLKDAAMSLVFGAIPEPSESELDRALAAAAAHALEHGVTQVHDMAGWSSLDTYRRARARGALPLRVYSVVPMVTWERLRDFVAAEGRGSDRLWWGGLKAFVDGSLGSTTAWFHEPYLDEPDTRGLVVTDTTELASWILEADRAGLHPIVHAIGDRANDWLLDVYQRVVDENGERDRRLRIEHAQHLSPRAIGRIARLGVVASMQPYHAADDGRWAAKRIGPDRLSRTYAFRSLIDAGATLAFGSDWTVAPIDPFAGIDAAVTRRTLDGAHPDGWVPEQRIGLEETLLAYTRGGAFAGFSLDRTGTIEVGKMADLAVLSGSIFETASSDLASLRVDLTLVEGEIQFQRATAPP